MFTDYELRAIQPCIRERLKAIEEGSASERFVGEVKDLEEANLKILSKVGRHV